MKIPEGFAADLDRVARGNAPAATGDPEHNALMAAAGRLSATMRPLTEAPPDVRERLEARLVAQLPEAARARWRPSLHLRPLRRWQPVVGLATAAALVLAILGAAFVWNGSPQSVSAQAILDRAQETAAQDAAPSGITNYHLTATRQVPAKLNVTVSDEIWYAGNDRQRQDEQITDASGAVVETSGTITNGTETWIYRIENGQTRVVHTTGTQWTAPSTIDPAQSSTVPAQGGSVADAIAQYNQQDKGCQAATQQGQATIAGRAAYVIVLTPKEECEAAKQQAAATHDATVQAAKEQTAASNPAAQAKIATAQAGQHANDQGAGKPVGQADGKAFGHMTVWVDTQTFLPLKTEAVATDGTVLDHYEVTSIAYNVAIPDSTFTYTPSANATVYTFNGTPADAIKATVGASESKEPPPAKKP